MAFTVADPETAKAATLSTDMVHMSVPISKAEDTPGVNPVDGTPDLIISGKCTDGTIDSDLQVVDPEASLRWIKTWYDTKANIRMQHDPKRPVGRGIDVQGHYLKALITDPSAKHAIRNKVLNDFSIGIMHPEIRKGDPRFRHLDPMGKAVNGVITDRADGLTSLGEISVVDRGANYGSAFTLVKAAADGSAEWVGEWSGPAPSAPAAAKGGLTSVELPSDMKLKVTPATLAKMATLKRNLVLEEAAMKAAAPAPAAPEAAKSDILTAERRKLASEGRALKDGSYPIRAGSEGHKDANDALTLAYSHHGDWKAALKLVRRIARKEGWKDILERMAHVKAEDAGKADKGAGMKCMKCDGTGMTGDKACMACKKGRKMSARMAKAAWVTEGKKKKETREDSGVTAAIAGAEHATSEAIADQHADPDNTTDPADAAVMAHLHDAAGDLSGAAGAQRRDVGKKRKAMCMGCGARQNHKHSHCSECGRDMGDAAPVMKNHDFSCLHCGTDLDKGEKHCPGCGAENPGYNALADLKIPANKTAKGRVTKSKKDRKARRAEEERDFDGHAAPEFGSGKRKAEKRKGKGRNPGAGVKGEHTTGLPAHEPGGEPVAAFEDDLEMKTSMRHKASGLDPALAQLHDLTCAAFAPAVVARALPSASFKAIDTAWWSDAALRAASGTDFRQAMDAYNKGAVLSSAALALKTGDAQLIHAARLRAHKAFLKANKDLIGKTFTDATPGPGHAPTPGEVMPGRFNRPYLSAGHAADSPQHDGPRHFPVPTGTPEAMQYDRGYLSAGHAADAPDNSPHRAEPVPENSAGRPQRVFYSGMARRDYEQAIRTMHDHLSRIAPGICPMSPEPGHIPHPDRPVPAGVGAPAPHKGKSAKPEAAKAAKPRRTVTRAAQHVITASQPLTGKLEARSASADRKALRAAAKAATAPLVKQLRAQDKALKRQEKMLHAIAGQPDTSQAPMRAAGVWAQKTSGVLEAPRTAAEAMAMAQTGHMQRLYKEMRESTNPQAREAARAEYTALLGLAPMTGNDTNPQTIPYRT